MTNEELLQLESEALNKAVEEGKTPEEIEQISEDFTKRLEEVTPDELPEIEQIEEEDTDPAPLPPEDSDLTPEEYKQSLEEKVAELKFTQEDLIKRVEILEGRSSEHQPEPQPVSEPIDEWVGLSVDQMREKHKKSVNLQKALDMKLDVRAWWTEKRICELIYKTLNK